MVVLRSPIHANEPGEYNGMLYRTSNRVLNNGIKVIILICMDGTSQYHHHPKFGRKNPWSKCNSLLGSKVMQGSARSTRGQNSLEMPCCHKIWQKGPQTRVQCIDGVKGLAGVSWGQPKVKLLRNVIWLIGNKGSTKGQLLRNARIIKCSQCYRALCSCRCSSLQNKIEKIGISSGWK